MAGKPKPKKEYVQEGSGRPSKFTPERCAAIIAAIAKRAPYEYAAGANGISEATLYIWLDIAKDHLSQNIESEYTVFLEGIKKAELDRIIEHNDMIASHVDKWQGDAWLLERRWHKHYSPNAGLNELNTKLDKLMEHEKNEKRNGQENSQEDSQES
jgi:hypothetical protein